MTRSERAAQVLAVYEAAARAKKEPPSYTTVGAAIGLSAGYVGEIVAYLRYKGCDSVPPQKAAPTHSGVTSEAIAMEAANTRALDRCKLEMGWPE